MKEPWISKECCQVLWQQGPAPGLHLVNDSGSADLEDLHEGREQNKSKTTAIERNNVSYVVINV